MKDKIHPKYEKITIKCACGNTFETRSTASNIHLDICSECHPFFTGKQKLVDTDGRIEKFNKKYGNNITGAKKKAQAAPAPVVPAPEPAPAEPAPEPAPAEPAPEPVPVEPTPAPAPVEPAPEPAPVEPAPAENTPESDETKS